MRSYVCFGFTPPKAFLVRWLQISDFGLSRELKTAAGLHTKTYGTVTHSACSTAAAAAGPLPFANFTLPSSICSASTALSLIRHTREKGYIIGWCSNDAFGTEYGNCEKILLTAVPPELLLDNKLTTASDVFAYGVLLFELACCRQAWEGMSHTQVLAAVTVDRRRLAFDPHVLPGIVVSTTTPPPPPSLHLALLFFRALWTKTV